MIITGVADRIPERLSRLIYLDAYLPEDDDFCRFAERARARGWPVLIVPGDHVPQWHQPEATAKLILSIH